jgi:predicted ATPase/class 3 adenylate cyclase
MASRSGLPAGILTCVFTDIEGSTRLLRELGTTFHEVLARHDAALRNVWAQHDGYEVKTLGDSFLVVFEEAGDAVAAAVAAQRAIAAVRWPTPLPIRIRIGMHTGYAQPTNDDYTAMVVNQAARVVGAARGGQVLLTEETAAHATAGGGRDDVTVVPLGRYRVRDFDVPVALYTAAGPGVLAVALPPRVRPADGHNLVRPVTSLVGRHREVDRLGVRLAAGRVTTIVGPGGVGKTRLATETALQVAGDWRDGAWFVDLAPLGDGALVGDAIGDAVGAPTAPGSARWPEVLDHLAEREVLVVLDNCEHVTQAAARAAAELVSGCPQVAVLATSRGPLGLRGEQVHRLQALQTEGVDAPAVLLFLDRSGAGDDEQLEADRAVIAELCAELDGLPLAIELAAARTTAVPPGEILHRMRRSATVIRSTDPTLPDRQRSLDDLLDWSWDLLPAPARTVLSRLSVFSAGFDVDAAEAVGAGGEIDVDEVAELLWTLIDASRVRAEDTTGATRNRLQSTVRAHAPGRADATDLADATYRLAVLLLHRIGPERARGHAWGDAMGLELENVRGAAARVDHPGAAHALMWSVGRRHEECDTLRDGITELTRHLAGRPEAGPERVGLLSMLADLHLRLDELDAADAVLDEASSLEAVVGPPDWEPTAVTRSRGELAFRRGDTDAAQRIAQEGLEQATSDRARARLNSLLGCARCVDGDLDGGVAAFEGELRAATLAGLETFLVATHGNLAEAHLSRGDEAAAIHHQRIALGLAREHRPMLVAFSLMIAARLVARRGQWHDAVLLQTRADELLDAAGYVLYEDDRATRAALLADARGHLGDAAFTAAVADGRALGADAAADLAERILTRAGPTPDDPQRSDR